MFNKLSNEKKPSNIMRQILDAIDQGRLKEADKLPNELELTIEFGVSRSVVREAMSSLVTMGVIKRVPGNGTFVQSKESMNLNTSDSSTDNRAIFWDHLEEIEKVEGSYDAYLARLLIEPIITEYTARRIEKSALRKLKSIYLAMDRAVKDKDLRNYQMEDLKFHMELAKASANEVLYNIFKEIMDLIGFNLWDACRIWPEDSKSVLRSLNDHKVLLELIENDNPVLAKNKMEEHLRAAFWEYKDMK
ncbi:MAG: FCD domain-containing protein [bacterium]|nr:FCD domain-containing protein [bacterium]